MKRYSMTFARVSEHTPEHPDRTAIRGSHTSLDFDVYFQVWPSAESMRVTLEMQAKRAPMRTDWQAWLDSNWHKRRKAVTPCASTVSILSTRSTSRGQG